MTPHLAAMLLLAAIGMVTAAPAHAQEPEPAAPVVRVTSDRESPVDARKAPRRAGRPPRAVQTEPAPPPAASTPGMVAGREEGKTDVSEQRGGSARDGGGRPPDSASGRRPGGGSDGGRGARAPVHVPRGARPGAGSWGPPPARFAHPWYYDPFFASGAFGWSPLWYAPWSLMWGTAGLGPFPGVWGTTTFDTGGVRLKVRPRDAQVFVNGYYAGIVDDFDGLFQSLQLAPGGYKLEIRMPGYEPFALDVHIQPDRTMTVKETLRALP